MNNTKIKKINNNMKKSIFQKLDDLHPMVGAVLLGAGLPAVALLLVVFFSSIDNEPSFNGTYLYVTAAFKQVFEQEFKLRLALCGIAVSGLIPMLYNWKFKGASAGTGDYSGGHVYFIGWGLFLVMAIGSWNFKYNSSEYQKIVDEKTFQYLKANPDKVDSVFAK